MTEKISTERSFFGKIFDGVKDAAQESLTEVSTTFKEVTSDPKKALGAAVMMTGVVGIPVGMYRSFKRIAGKAEDTAAVAGALWRGSARDVAKQATKLFIHKTAQDAEDALALLGAKASPGVASTAASTTTRASSWLSRYFRPYAASAEKAVVTPSATVTGTANKTFTPAKALGFAEEPLPLAARSASGAPSPKFREFEPLPPLAAETTGVGPTPQATPLPKVPEIAAESFSRAPKNQTQAIGDALQSTLNIHGRAVRIETAASTNGRTLHAIVSDGGPAQHVSIRLRGTQGQVATVLRGGQHTRGVVDVPYALPAEGMSRTVFTALTQKIRETGSVRIAMDWLKNDSFWAKAGLIVR